MGQGLPEEPPDVYTGKDPETEPQAQDDVKVPAEDAQPKPDEEDEE